MFASYPIKKKKKKDQEKRRIVEKFKQGWLFLVRLMHARKKNKTLCCYFQSLESIIEKCVRSKNLFFFLWKEKVYSETDGDDKIGNFGLQEKREE